MLNKNLLEKTLLLYKHKFEPCLYNSKLIKNLLKKYKDYEMIEDYYCCYGDDVNCWQEYIGEGNWGLTKKDVKNNINYRIKELNCVLSENNRCYIYETEEEICIYIYSRDIIKMDLRIYFYKSK